MWYNNKNDRKGKVLHVWKIDYWQSEFLSYYLLNVSLNFEYTCACTRLCCHELQRFGVLFLTNVCIFLSQISSRPIKFIVQTMLLSQNTGISVKIHMNDKSMNCVVSPLWNVTCMFFKYRIEFNWMINCPQILITWLRNIHNHISFE